MSQALDAHGEHLLMLPQCALLWPARHMLVVADIHFGKAAAFRASGVPVPGGTTRDNLTRLDALVTQHGVRHIVFLGDFLHARAGRAPATLAALAQWRARQSSLALTLVRGNHDRHAGDPPAELGITVVDEPWRCGPLALCHHPQTVAGAFALAGHVHPVLRLVSGADAVRLPCFVAADDSLLLPAFGAFTGGHAVVPQAGERVFLVAGDVVLALDQRR